MILDYNYSENKKKMSISYIDDSGNKKILDFNVSKFKTYYNTPTGQYRNWDGSLCDIKYTTRPSKFDIKTFFEEMDDRYKTLISGKTAPKLYTFDIETEITDEFPEPSAAKQRITTISIASPDCNVMVLGTRELDEVGTQYLKESFSNYVNNTDFFKTLNLPQPYIKYIYFSTEKEMLEWFLKNIVSKVAVLAGWNSILFDWNYITNRIKNFYPELSVQLASCSYQTRNKGYSDMRGDRVYLQMPIHTLIVDMMDVVMNFDMAVLPIKEAQGLDYIAKESLGVRKIEYDGSLQDLYDSDYPKYVFYNAIDSFLVQLIDKRFRTLNIIYLQSLYCTEKIGDCFSKILLAEALTFKEFYKKGLKIVYEDKSDIERGRLLGAYVKEPRPGKYNFIACNDFASLYPSTICTCNLSFENYIGSYYNEEELNKYRGNSAYIIIGPRVFLNGGTASKPEIGEQWGIFLDDEKLSKYRGNPDYFVTVNGSVYRNDKDYAFKNIQITLKSDRGVSKYLAKELDAKVVLDIEHIKKGMGPHNTQYSDRVVNCLRSMGYNVKCTEDLNKINLQEFESKLKLEIEYHTSNEQAMKLLGNSMYGGSSHVSFYWFNMALANDITGESRNLINLMEKHLPEFMKENWEKMEDIHEKLGIKLNHKRCKEILKSNDSFITVVYGDTDSVAGNTLIHTESGEKTIEQLFNENMCNDKFKTHNGHELVTTSDKVLNWNGDLNYTPVNYIMRHKVTKPKWRLKTKSGQEVIVTNDHSMIVFRNGEKLEVKPYEIKPTDKILVVMIEEYFFDEIEVCECIGMFEDEYVYDIEVADETHTFIANDILVHNSLYTSYENLIKTIDGYEKMSTQEILKVLVEFNTKFLDNHNKEFITKYYNTRFGKSVHEFELETIAKSGVWLDVKKRYAQILLWKDGKYYDEDDLPMKTKGLEMVKSSVPKFARGILTRLVRYFLDESDDMIVQKLNMKVQQEKQGFLNADIETISGNMKVNNYTKYIEDDCGASLKVASKCPSNVRAAGNYNQIRNYHKLPGDPIYGGKVKWYKYKVPGSMNKIDYFAFQSMNYPEWADKYAPVCRKSMFEQFVLDPFNRITGPVGIPALEYDGNIQISLF